MIKLQGHIRKHQSGWSAIIELPPGPELDKNGKPKRKQKWITSKTTEEVQEKLNEALFKLQNGEFATDSNQTLG